MSKTRQSWRGVKRRSNPHARVCTRTTIPYARHLEDQTLPNVERICAQVKELVSAR